MAEEQSRPGGSARGGIGEGIRSGIGILTAFKDAIEETIQEAVNRGDLSPDRAREAVRNAAARVQEGLGDARERLDFVPRRDFEELRTEVATLRAEVTELRGRLERHEGAPEHDAGGSIIPVGDVPGSGLDAIPRTAGDADPFGSAGEPLGGTDAPSDWFGGATSESPEEPDLGSEPRDRPSGFPIDEG